MDEQKNMNESICEESDQEQTQKTELTKEEIANEMLDDYQKSINIVNALKEVTSSISKDDKVKLALEIEKVRLDKERCLMDQKNKITKEKNDSEIKIENRKLILEEDKLNLEKEKNEVVKAKTAHDIDVENRKVEIENKKVEIENQKIEIEKERTAIDARKLDLEKEKNDAAVEMARIQEKSQRRKDILGFAGVIIGGAVTVATTIIGVVVFKKAFNMSLAAEYVDNVMVKRSAADAQKAISNFIKPRF